MRSGADGRGSHIHVLVGVVGDEPHNELICLGFVYSSNWDAILELFLAAEELPSSKTHMPTCGALRSGDLIDTLAASNTNSERPACSWKLAVGE